MYSLHMSVGPIRGLSTSIFVIAFSEAFPRTGLFNDRFGQSCVCNDRDRKFNENASLSVVPPGNWLFKFYFVILTENSMSAWSLVMLSLTASKKLAVMPGNASRCCKAFSMMPWPCHWQLGLCLRLKLGVLGYLPPGKYLISPAVSATLDLPAHANLLWASNWWIVALGGCAWHSSSESYFFPNML